ncbi:molybdenum cofactor guanylyltransferase [Paenibacillus sp. GCM10012307]|uniref:Molybdenum cofactor guanylyltransferase n=1 Tax=Paenibacillus roseus TaxID=2798579 RepID=A0A934J8I4_9BACL|nr:molybdenum cofactor guanylyltransferase [Paenibacillus roseus]MBJ6362646.1 molybdenum cofactor guanylyltransferase [Paenibacillus roseus]
MDVTGVILAGSRASRTAGKPSHAFWFYNGEMMLERQLSSMRQFCKERIVVTDSPKPFLDVLDPNVRLITDFAAGNGPLGGLHAALHLSTHPVIWAVACDLPLLNSKAAEYMTHKLEGYDAVVPVLNNRLQPWFGIYDKRCAKVASELLNHGLTSPLVFLSFIQYKPVPAFEFLEHGIDPGFLYRLSHPNEMTRPS